MDIMELGAIGELVEGVAVIGSLVYLSLQVRQSAMVQSKPAARPRGAVDWWQQMSADFSPDFRAFVEQAIRRRPAEITGA